MRIVSWRCSIETRRDLAENIVIDSSHFGLGAHPAALYAIADRLAQPEDRWEAFQLRGWRRIVYRDPQKLLARRKERAMRPRSETLKPSNPDAHRTPPPRRHKQFTRSFFLSTFPTEVSGRSSTNMIFSGIAIFDMTPFSTYDATWSRMSSSMILPM